MAVGDGGPERLVTPETSGTLDADNCLSPDAIRPILASMDSSVFLSTFCPGVDKSRCDQTGDDGPEDETNDGGPDHPTLDEAGDTGMPDALEDAGWGGVDTDAS